MIPIADSPRSRTFPYVNVGLIAACVGVFIYELTLSGAAVNRFFFDYGVVPTQLNAWLHDPSGLGVPSTAITSAFVHAGWLHLAGNMIFLWVFGDNVEDAFGHLRYLAFYLVAGVAAVALQVATDTTTAVPVVGASGAIAGVLGAYVVLYPRATVRTIIPIVWFFGALPIPAVVLILIWFLLQLFTGLASIGTATGGSEGIAVWAHVGGFLAGGAIAVLFRPLMARPPSPASSGRRLGLW